MDEIHKLKALRYHGASLKSFFAKKGWKRIAIYGGGGVGFALYEDMRADGVKPCCIIDKNPNVRFPYPIEVIFPQDLKKRKDFDCIIVTPIQHRDNILKSLATMTAIPIIEITTVIAEIEYQKRIFIDKNNVNDLLRRWRELRRRGYSLKQALSEHHGRKIVIYGTSTAVNFCEKACAAEGLEVKHAFIPLENDKIGLVKDSHIHSMIDFLFPFISPDDVIILAYQMKDYHDCDSHGQTRMLYKIFAHSRHVVALDQAIGSLFADSTTHPYADTVKSLMRHVHGCGATLFFFDYLNPVFHLKSPNHHEEYLKLHYASAGGLSKDGLLSDLPQANEEYIASIRDIPLDTVLRNDVYYMADVQAPYKHIVNGIRLTTDAPQSHTNAIHCFGPCHMDGYLVEDSLTIPSQLQRLVNASPLSNKTYRLFNHGVNGTRLSHAAKRISQTPIKKNDIVIVMNMQYPSPSVYADDAPAGVYFCDLVPGFDRPHEYGEVFSSCFGHTSHRGYALIAKRMHKVMKETLGGGKISPRRQATSKKSTDETTTIDASIEAYLDYLQAEKVKIKGKAGAIVMNCNPFTLGHRHIIATAAKEVDFLYIFCVEEDKSDFSFDSRIMLLRKGTKDLKNVKVIRSGRFILSTVTFPGYFSKDSRTSVSVDAAKDIETFATRIAPALNITVRFAGEEPTCQVTNQYNATMRDVLPKHGVRFKEFKRLEADSKPISASSVRKLISEGDFKSLRKLVPKTTYDYLRKNCRTVELD